MQSIAGHLMLDEGQTILIAYHLHKRCFSIRYARSKKVVGYTDRIIVRQAQFSVSESGRQRVLRERRKNVHAYVRGEFEKGLQDVSLSLVGLHEAYYNPYHTATFVDKATAEPIKYAEIVLCENGKVYYY